MAGSVLTAQSFNEFDWLRLQLRSGEAEAERAARRDLEYRRRVLVDRVSDFTTTTNGCIEALARGVVDRKVCGAMYRAWDALEKTDGWPSRGMVKK